MLICIQIWKIHVWLRLFWLSIHGEKYKQEQEYKNEYAFTPLEIQMTYGEYSRVSYHIDINIFRCRITIGDRGKRFAFPQD